MRKEGCEIEAVGVNYSVQTSVIRRDLLHLKHLFCSHRKPHPPCEEERQGVRQVLTNVHCHAKPWQILAVAGPSGAGKSSLLQILAGKIIPQTAAIFINGKPLNPATFRKISGYVAQKDTLFPLLTVEETLTFAAKLRLRLPPYELSSRVRILLEELGLQQVAGTRVGDDRTKGISGGERRRVSIGIEAIHEPSVLILDEPTSGLDSTSALQIIQVLKAMTETKGRTVILSIHQPSFRIVKLLNSILLLDNGSVLHHGSVDQLDDLLKKSIQLHRPLHVNPVEFAIESIGVLNSIDLNGSKQNSRSKSTLQQLFFQSNVEIDSYPQEFSNSVWKETMILTHRFGKIILRTRELFAFRTLQMLISGLVLGSIFYHPKDDLLGAEERVGLFAFVLTFLLSSSIEALPMFLQERDILMKETFNGSYRVSSYAISNGVVYLPFLLILSILFAAPLYFLAGLNPLPSAFCRFVLLIWIVLYTANSLAVCFSALVPNFIVGNSVISGVMGSFFLFSGYFVSQRGIPKYWMFMHYLSVFKYPFEGFLMNEFAGSGNCLGYMFGHCVATAEGILREEGYDDGSGWWKNFVIMVAYVFAYRFISYLILRLRCNQRSFKWKI